MMFITPMPPTHERDAGDAAEQDGERAADVAGRAEQVVLGLQAEVRRGHGGAALHEGVGDGGLDRGLVRARCHLHVHLVHEDVAGGVARAAEARLQGGERNVGVVVGGAAARAALRRHHPHDRERQVHAAEEGHAERLPDGGSLGEQGLRERRPEHDRERLAGHFVFVDEAAVGDGHGAHGGVRGGGRDDGHGLVGGAGDELDVVLGLLGGDAGDAGEVGRGEGIGIGLGEGLAAARGPAAPPWRAPPRKSARA
jgi:hypothetical protein